jgi:regulator of sigma E protease
MLTLPAFVLLLGVLITVHELGHFLVAKACGVKVLTFSIGFGPRLFGFTRGETEYRVSVLPLGGYVRMYGDDITEEVPASQQHRSFLHQPFLKKTAIAFAGPAMNLLLPVAIFFAMGLGTQRVPEAMLGSVLPGEVAAQAGLQDGDRVVAIDGERIARFSQLQAYVNPRPGVPIRLTVERKTDDGSARTFDVSVTPKAAPDPTVFEPGRTVGRLGVVAGVELPVVVVEPGSPAAAAGILDLDRVAAVDGKPIGSKAALVAALDAAGDSVRLDVVTEAHEEPAPVVEGQPAQPPKKVPESRRTVTLARAPAVDVAEAGLDRFGVTSDELADAALAARVDGTKAALVDAQRASARRFGLAPVDGLVSFVAPGTVAAEKGLREGKDRVVAVDGKPLLTPNDLETALRADPDGVHVIGVVRAPDDKSGARAEVLAFRMLPAPERMMGGIKVFGVGLTSAFGEGPTVEYAAPPAEALRNAFTQTGQLVVDVIKGFGLLFTGKVGLESLGGPITIAKMSGQAAQAGSAIFLGFMCTISVNLAVLNLLPIPVLDGGHILMFIVELVRRKRLTPEQRMSATKVGLLFVGLLMVVAIGNDVLGLFR